MFNTIRKYIFQFQNTVILKFRFSHEILKKKKKNSLVVNVIGLGLTQFYTRFGRLYFNLYNIRACI